MANWMAREEALTVGRTVLLGAAWILASACTYLAEDGSVMFPANEAFALELPEHCEATRTSSGYTISCTESEGTGSGDSVATSEFAATEGVPLGEGASPPVTPEVDYCDDAPFAGATWTTLSAPHFTLHAIDGTAAATDGAAVLAQHEAAYAAVTAALELDSEPAMQLVLSPNRAAASHYGLDWGLAIPGFDRIEAIYDGAADSYIRLHPGYLVTASLLGHVVPENHYVLPVLAVGLSEHLDQSGRDLHQAYAYSVVSALDGAVTLGVLGEEDVWGDSAAAAGSLVSFMVTRHGMDKVMDLVDATAVTWQDDGYLHSEQGFIDTEERLDTLLDQAIPEAMGEQWEDLRGAWQLEVLERLSETLPEVGAEDRAAIVNLVRVADLALNTNDTDAYRAVMDGFYCEGFDDAARFELAAEMTEAMADVETEVLRVYPAATRNYKTARVLATRRQGFDGVSTTYYDVEHFPAGWRITGTPEW